MSVLNGAQIQIMDKAPCIRGAVTPLSYAWYPTGRTGQISRPQPFESPSSMF